MIHEISKLYRHTSGAVDSDTGKQHHSPKERSGLIAHTLFSAQMAYLFADIVSQRVPEMLPNDIQGNEAARLRYLEEIKLGGFAHDIGKLWVPEEILWKNGPLTADEFEEMKKHPEHGAAFFGGTKYKNLISSVLFHHERWDGKGYPYGLVECEIPLEARIVAVADSAATMMQKRCYKDAFGSACVIEELEKNSGTQFDPAIATIALDVFKKCLQVPEFRTLEKAGDLHALPKVIQMATGATKDRIVHIGVDDLEIPDEMLSQCAIASRNGSVCATSIIGGFVATTA